MEQRYKAALEILLNLCKEGYPTNDQVQVICETALNESEEKENG